MTTTFDRRYLLRSTGAAALAASLLPRVARAADPLTVGVIYVGARDDFGWNQAHAVGVKALKGLPNIKVVEEENVPETDAVSKTMESMINLDGAKLILPTSFGYWSPFVLDEAKSNPGVQFRHAAPLWKESDPKNSGSYFACLDQAHYVDGVAAGLASKTGKLGFVAAKPVGIVLRNINSFLTGARTTNPNATVQVIFTGDNPKPRYLLRADLASAVYGRSANQPPRSSGRYKAICSEPVLLISLKFVSAFRDRPLQTGNSAFGQAWNYDE